MFLLQRKLLFTKDPIFSKGSNISRVSSFFQGGGGGGQMLISVEGVWTPYPPQGSAHDTHLLFGSFVWMALENHLEV